MIIDMHAHTPYGRDGWDAFLHECRANGLARTIVSALGPEAWKRYPTLGQLRGANDLSAEFKEYGGGLIDWIAYLNPQVDGNEEELDRCLAMGAVGVKLWVSMKGEDGSLDRAIRLVRAIGERSVPVLIHTFDLADVDPRNPGALFSNDLAELGRACPDTQIIGAHAGGNWKRGMGVLADLPNVSVDISGGHPERGEVEKLLPDLGHERILYGSDMYGRRVSAQLAKVVFADLEDEQREAILWGNAARIFGLKDVKPVEAEGVHVWRKAPPDPAVEHNAFCGHWPYNPEPGMTPGEFEIALERFGIREAWVGHLDTVFRYDVSDVNRAFKQDAAKCDRIRPLATLVPTACNWRYALDCAVRDGFRGAVVFPYLHGWRLDVPEHRPFFEACAEKGLGLWINLTMSDHRFRPPGTGWRPVAGDELRAFLEGAPRNLYVFQAPDAGQATILAEADAPEGGAFQIGISRLSDYTGQFERIAEKAGRERLVFGSEFPLRDLRTVRYALGAEL